MPSKINELMKKWTNELNRTFSKEEVQMTKKHTKKCSPSLAIKEMPGSKRVGREGRGQWEGGKNDPNIVYAHMNKRKKI
jgi:hypothetical protein